MQITKSKLVTAIYLICSLIYYFYAKDEILWSWFFFTYTYSYFLYFTLENLYGTEKGIIFSILTGALAYTQIKYLMGYDLEKYFAAVLSLIAAIGYFSITITIKFVKRRKTL